MGQWFDERFISREEHEQIVAYYRKLVARLYGNVRDMQLLAAAERAVPPPAFEDPFDFAEAPDEVSPESDESQLPEPNLGSNVISLGSYRERRAARLI